MITSDAEYSDNPLEVYQREVGKVPPLDPAEEAVCVEHVRASDELADAARVRLVEANLQRVIELAQDYQNESNHILDLIEQGNKGLLAALDHLGQLSEGSFWEFARLFVQRSLRELHSPNQELE